MSMSDNYKKNPTLSARWSDFRHGRIHLSKWELVIAFVLTLLLFVNLFFNQGIGSLIFFIIMGTATAMAWKTRHDAGGGAQ